MASVTPHAYDRAISLPQGDNGAKGPEGAPGKDGARVSSKPSLSLLLF